MYSVRSVTFTYPQLVALLELAVAADKAYPTERHHELVVFIRAELARINAQVHRLVQA